MKRQLTLVFFLSLNLYAQNLLEIQEALGSSKKARLINEKTTTQILENRLLNSQEAPELGLSISRADEVSKEGLEYSLEVSQELNNPFALGASSDAIKHLNSLTKEQGAYQLRLMAFEVGSKYHLACVSKQISEGAKMLYREQESKYTPLQKAYELGEISRKMLLFNKLDLMKLKQKVDRYKRDYLSALEYLQQSVDNLTIDTLACDDLEDILQHKDPDLIQQHAQIKTIHHKQNSTKAFYDLHNAMFSSLGYALAYEKELDTTRYTFGVSIPLGALSSKKQTLKAQYLQENASLSTQKEARLFEIQQKTKSITLKLQTLYREYKLLHEQILPMSLELKTLAKSALNEGEGTIMEYLDATRSYSENFLEMLAVKKSYYKTLFEFYKQTDQKLGEKK